MTESVDNQQDDKIPTIYFADEISVLRHVRIRDDTPTETSNTMIAKRAFYNDGSTNAPKRNQIDHINVVQLLRKCTYSAGTLQGTVHKLHLQCEKQD